LPGLGPRLEGKVRDSYVRSARVGGRGRTERILITTDRISAFDRVLG
jgi:phosphoribosylaminoimidazole-succinocarboxamide synthase